MGAGVGAAFGLRKVPKIGVLLVGGFGGMVAAIYLNIAFLCYVGYLMVYFVAAALFGAGVVLAFFSHLYALIISTSLIGAYLFMRAFSVFLGGFPNELLFYKNYDENKAYDVRRIR